MVGVGVDLIEIKRFRGKKYVRTSPLLKQMFMPEELDYCFSKRNPAARLSTHFAAKEALWKALAESKSFTTPLYTFLQEVAVTHDERGKPAILFLAGYLQKHRALVSLSDSGSHAIAMVILQR